MSNGRTEILTAINDGEQIITSGLANLQDGDALTVVQQQAPPAPPADDVTAPPSPARSETLAPLVPTTEHARHKQRVVSAAPKPAEGNEIPSTVHAAKTGQPAHTAKTWYHCPMHPNMESDKPGKCPICGMDYVPFRKN